MEEHCGRRDLSYSTRLRRSSYRQRLSRCALRVRYNPHHLIVMADVASLLENQSKHLQVHFNNLVLHRDEEIVVSHVRAVIDPGEQASANLTLMAGELLVQLFEFCLAKDVERRFQNPAQRVLNRVL